MTKLNPLPWKSDCVDLFDADGKVIANLQGIFSQRMANGDFIAYTCNKHNDLIEALTRIVTVMDPDGDEDSYRGDDPEGAMDTAYWIAKNAIEGKR